jgi:hypothetical protein
MELVAENLIVFNKFKTGWRNQICVTSVTPLLQAFTLILKKTGNLRIDITYSSVRVTTVAVEKQ